MHYIDVSHRGLSSYIQEFASKKVVLENEISFHVTQIQI